MVDAVIRLVEQREVKELGHPALRDDAARRAVHRRAGEADVLHILAQTLHIRGQPRREQMHPEEIFPSIEDRNAVKMTVQMSAVTANSVQMRRRNSLFRMGEPRRRNVRTKRNGVKSSPIVSSSTAARTRAARGICGWTKGQSSSSRSEAR